MYSSFTINSFFGFKKFHGNRSAIFSNKFSLDSDFGVLKIPFLKFAFLLSICSLSSAVRLTFSFSDFKLSVKSPLSVISHQKSSSFCTNSYAISLLISCLSFWVKSESQKVFFFSYNTNDLYFDMRDLFVGDLWREQ